MPIKFYSWLKKTALLIPILALAAMGTATAQCAWINNAPWIVQPTYKMYTNQTGSNGLYISRCSTAKANINFDNSSSYPAASDTNNYSYYGGPSGKLCKAEAGKKVEIFVSVGYLLGTPNNSTPRIAVWVDWNHNGVFEETTNYTELVTFTKAISTTCLANGIITSSAAYGQWEFEVPKFAKNGLTRMRIRAGGNGVAGFQLVPAGMTACLQAGHGECEDYDFEVVNPCKPPQVISISNVTCSGADICWSDVENADLFDYYVDTCKDPGCGVFPPPPGGFIYYYSTLSDLTCRTVPNTDYSSIMPDTKYYVNVRSTCDTIQKPTSQYWQNSAWTLDSFTTLPCCNSPENIQVNDVKSTTATASWDPVYTAYRYEYAVVTTPNNPPSSGTQINGTSIFLQGLTHSKTYYFCVRALCSPTPKSLWECRSFATENTTSVDDFGKNVPAITAYPNPVKNTVTISVDNYTGGEGVISITDVTGKIVRSVDMNSAKQDIDMSNLRAGLYLVKYESAFGGSKVIKITKD